MWWIVVVTLSGWVFAAGATRAEEPPVAGISPEARAILDDVLPAGSYSATGACVSLRSVRKVDVLDSGHILFSARREAWLNRLALNCRGLRPGQLLEFSQYGSRLCRHDTLLARERGIAAGEDFPPRCRLGSFEKVDLQQAAMLREQFRQLRLSRRQSSRSPERDAQATRSHERANKESKGGRP